jgi:hypothetical protein
MRYKTAIKYIQRGTSVILIVYIWTILIVKEQFYVQNCDFFVFS